MGFWSGVCGVCSVVSSAKDELSEEKKIKKEGEKVALRLKREYDGMKIGTKLKKSQNKNQNDVNNKLDEMLKKIK